MTPPDEVKLLPYQKFSSLKHGHAKHGPRGKYTPTYQSWQAMLSRCRYLFRDKTAKHCGRGIAVWDRWYVFENFLSDMGERPDGTSLDRIDNNGDYHRDNCRWATPIDQARNRRNKKLEYMDAYTICCRMLSGYTAKSVAQDFGCSESLPREILKGRTWKDAHVAAHQFMEVPTHVRA